MDEVSELPSMINVVPQLENFYRIFISDMAHALDKLAQNFKSVDGIFDKNN